MARPRKVSEATILKAARDIFIQLGPNASTRLIAEAVGLSTPALFNHFPTKRELLIAALTPPKDIPWIHLLKLGPTDQPLESQLLAIATEIKTYFIEVGMCMSILHASNINKEELLSRYDTPPPVLAIKNLAKWFEQAIEIGIVRPLDSQQIARTFLGSLHMEGFLRHVLGEPEVYLSPLDISTLVNIYAHGLKPIA